MKVLLASYYEVELDFQVRVAKKLLNMGIDAALVPFHQRADYPDIPGNIIKAYPVFRELLEQWNTKDYSQLMLQTNKIADRYGVADLRNMVKAHCSYDDITMEDEQQMAIILAYFNLWENVLKENPCDLVFSGDGGELFRTSLFKVSKFLGIQLAVNLWVPFPGMVSLVNNPMNIQDEYPIEDLNGVSNEDCCDIRNFFNQIRSSSKDYVRLRKKVIQTRHLWMFCRSVFRKFCLKDINYSQYGIGRRAKKLLVRNVRKFVFKHLYSNPDENVPFVFYPFHAQNDAQITVRAPQFHMNQEYLIEQIARSLPCGYKLYVKEHPAEIGGVSYSCMKTLLKRNSNVKLISPYVHPHKLISSCRAVATINSTTGFESIVFGKPTIVFGKAFYANKGFTTDIHNLSSLADSIKTALQTPPELSKVVKFMTYVKKCCFPGGIMSLDTSDKNVYCITDALAKKLSYKQKDIQQII